MLKQLRLREFRMFAALDFQPTPGTNFLIGPNAAGKTSVLESICVLLRLQSPRATSLVKCQRFGSEGFAVEGWTGDHHLQIRHDGRGRRLHLDSVQQSKSEEYLSVGRITWFSNEDLRLVQGTGVARRRFLDFLGSQLVTGYLRTLRDYERSLRARNFLLRAGGRGQELDAYTEVLAENGDALRSFRASLIPGILNNLSEAGGDISGGADRFSLEYVPGHEGDLLSALRKSRERELKQRTTLAGPHRDDLDLRANGLCASDFASEGQQRTLALAMKLAQSRQIEEATGRAPILLLDDIFGELDPGRRNRLLSSLSVHSQKFITTTFLEWKSSNPDDAIFRLRNGVWE